VSTTTVESAPELHPLRVGQILDTAIRLALRNARILLPIAATIVVPLAILDAIVLAATLKNGYVIDGTVYLQNASGYDAGRVVIEILQFIGGALVTGASFRALSASYLGGSPHVGESLRAALSRLGALLVVSIGVVLFTIVGFLLLFIPGAYFLIACSVAVPVLLLEGVPAFTAINRSFELTRGHWWRTFGVIASALVLFFVLGFLLGLGLGAILLGTSQSLLGRGIELVLTLVLTELIVRPFQAAVTTVLYYDLRVRKEGIDVEIMARDAGLIPGQGAEAQERGLGSPTHPESVGPPVGPPVAPDDRGGIPSG
jgi:hypothetical protein